MTSITVRHVPESVRDELAARAARAGQSLQEYMLAELSRLAERPSVAEWVADVRRAKSSAGTLLDADAVVADRDAERP